LTELKQAELNFLKELTSQATAYAPLKFTKRHSGLWVAAVTSQPGINQRFVPFDRRQFVQFNGAADQNLSLTRAKVGQFFQKFREIHW
jgi:hypothetical protein